MPLALLVVLSPYLIWLCRLDWKYRRLPNVWTLGGIGCALVWRLGFGGVGTMFDGIVGGLLCGAFLLLPFMLRGAGGGDVKMITAIGCVLGMKRVVLLLFSTSVAGLLLVILMLILGKADGGRLKHCFLCLFNWRYDRKAGKAALPPRDHESCRVPFGIAIAIGTWFTLAMEIFVNWRMR